jgi:glycosyltransferase involved in cell wall biosynthesis
MYTPGFAAFGAEAMAEALRVLLVGPLPPPSGGMANQTLQLRELLRREGLPVAVVDTQAPYRPAWVARVRGARALFRILPYVRALWRECRSADVVHVMANSGWSWYLFATPAIRIARLLRRPVIVNYRGGLAREFLRGRARSVRRTLRGVSLVVPSRFLEEVFRDHGMQAQVIPNVVDLDLFHPAPAGEPKSGMHVVVVRNLERLYGIDLALRVAGLLKSRLPGLRWSIAGSGADRDEFLRLAEHLQVTDVVTFTGRLDPVQIADLLRSADLVLNPVRADNMPNSVLEALACRVPVVSTRVGGVPYLVEHGVTAWLVEPESPDALAQGVLTILGEDGLRERIVAAGRKLAESCSWQVVRSQWLHAYRSAAGGH